MTFVTNSEDVMKFIDAVYNGRLDDVTLQSHLFVNDVERLNEALMESCKYGHLDVVKWLVKHTAVSVNCRQGFNYTPLVAACWYGCLYIVKYLVDKCRADANLPDGDGVTPLIAACCRISMSVSKYLLCEVSDLEVDAVDSNNNTALHYSICYDKGYRGFTQLHKVCAEKDDIDEIIKLVYVESHEINVQDNDGNTPLHKACEHGRKKVVDILMCWGASETITNDLRQTPAQLAKWTRHTELLLLLDRDSLWELWQKNKLSVASGYVMLLTLVLMQKKIRRKLMTHSAAYSCHVEVKHCNSKAVCVI